MSEWREYALGDILSFRTGKLDSNAAVENGKYPFFTCSPITLKINNYAFDENAILLAGNNANGVFCIKRYDGKFNAYQRTYVITTQEHNIDFLYYALMLQLDNFQQLSSGTATRFLTATILNSFKLRLPPLHNQRVIAEVLSSLDDKIDLLTRQNATLEALAQTYFRQWFVEEARENWEEQSLYTVINILGGGTPSTKIPEYWDGDIPWFTPKDANSLICMDTEKHITQSGLSHCNSKLYPAGTLFISARGTVGKLSICGVPMAMNQSCYAITGKGKIPNFIAYLASEYSIAELQQNASGAVFDTITTDTFKAIRLALPAIDDNFNVEADEKLKNYYEKIIANTHQILTLQKLRDTLLPKLVSGEVRVKN